MQAVILAGGLATRLGALTKETPKSLIEVGGKPFLAWQLEMLARSGFSEVVLLVGHLADRIRGFAGDGMAFGLELRYSEDGPLPLGTGGAVRRALGTLASEFLVTYGDSYLPFDYSAPLRDLVAHPEAAGTMAVFENRGQWDPSNTRVEGELVTGYQKGMDSPEFPFIDYGATALRREILAGYPENQAFGLDRVQGDLVRERRLRAYRAERRFYEIGSESGLRELEEHLAGASRDEVG